MRLPPDFQFSQTSLQDLAECARRFQLRYTERLAWPAPGAEPAAEWERRRRAGERFHRLAQQALLGLPAGRLAAADPEVRAWWRSFVEHAPALWGGGERPRPGRFWTEVDLSCALDAFRLGARYDLVLWGADGRLVIVDWKTSGRKPARSSLAARLQTRVYPWVLAAAGGALTGGPPPAPEQIAMVYWFAEDPREPEVFAYSAAQQAQDGQYLTDLAQAIRGLDPAADLRTPDRERCRFCVYRARCERGERPGPAAEAELVLAGEDLSPPFPGAEGEQGAGDDLDLPG
jgi:hypothetical protein